MHSPEMLHYLHQNTGLIDDRRISEHIAPSALEWAVMGVETAPVICLVFAAIGITIRDQ